ncbi:MAG TPA: MMPL family transporter [Actinomycetes bacterium]|jgi:RND superfamily putative drug exporter|nr:MMPL family transporter [Actinomycetes bacterium]
MIDTTLTSDNQRQATLARPGPLGVLAGMAFRRRRRVILGWVAALALAIGLSAAFAGDFAADYSAPGSDSKQAQDLLEQRFPVQAGDTVDVVVRSDIAVTASEVRPDVAGLLRDLGGLPHVAAVEDPYTTQGDISADGKTLVAHLKLDVANPVDMPVADSKKLLAAAQAAERPGLDIALGGQTIQAAEQGAIGSEGIGIAAAAIILLLTFGTVVAAGLPILVAVAGLAVSSTLIGLVAAIIDVPDWSTSLAAMMGIGIGIDYMLLMVTRFKEWRAAGLDPEAATVATLDTAGRSVLVAGSTVVVSMLGLFAMGLSFMRGAAVVTIMAVLVVMAAAVTLFPALLGYLGKWIDRLRVPLSRRRPLETTAGGHVVPARGWVRWSRFVDRHSIVASIAGVAILLALAAPFLGVRFGFPDAGNDASGRSTRQAYDMLAAGFGPGANGPLVVVADLTGGNDEGVVNRLADDLRRTPGVATVLPPQLNPARDAALLTVIPTTGPQDTATEDLVRTLRDDVIPAATDGTGSQVHVGGATALAIDTTSNIAERIPLLIVGVVALSMLLLLLAFRSIAIPVTAAVMNLLSVAASYGVVALFLQGGWAGQLIGIDTHTPMPAFIPVLMFAVLFGLSMDYEVFLISRMRESWLRSNGDGGRAVVDGLAGTGRVITAAAAIMIAVFAAFIPSPEVFLKVIGVGMAAAIAIDATVVRLLLVPAVMHLLGRANWWLPRSLDRRLPQLRVEGRPEQFLPATATPPQDADRRELEPAGAPA